MNDTKINAEQVFNTLNGYEEIGIQKAFGTDIGTLATSGQNIQVMRALVFVVARRDGLTHADAEKRAMEIPFAELLEMFETEEDPVALGES